MLKDTDVMSAFQDRGTIDLQLQGVEELDDIEYLRDVKVTISDSGGVNRVSIVASYEFDIDASEEQRKTSDLNVHIRIPLEFDKRLLSYVSEELTDTLRHELEHSGQTTEELMDCQRKVPDDKIWDTLLRAYEYYLCPAEVKAHAAGFMKRAKHVRLPYGSILDEELMAIYQVGLSHGYTEDELHPLMGEMRVSYRDYARARWPQAQGLDEGPKALRVSEYTEAQVRRYVRRILKEARNT
jgi:hypothetical protein